MVKGDFLAAQMRHVGRVGSGYEALPKFPRSAGQPWANIYAGPEHVIFGHHARRRLQVGLHPPFVGVTFAYLCMQRWQCVACRLLRHSSRLIKSP